MHMPALTPNLLTGMFFFFLVSWREMPVISQRTGLRLDQMSIDNKSKKCSRSTAILQTPFCMRCFTIQNHVFYEWKQKKSWMGTFPWSHDHDSCPVAFGNPLLYVWEKKNVEKPFLPWVRAVSKIYNSIGSMYPYERGSVSTVVCHLFVVRVRSDQRCAAKLSAWWAAKRRLISNDRHGLISFWILANKPCLFS